MSDGFSEGLVAALLGDLPVVLRGINGETIMLCSYRFDVVVQVFTIMY